MQNFDDNRIYWIWLQNICGAGSAMPELLLDLFDGSVVKLYEADEAEVSQIPFVKPALAKKLADKSLTKAKEIVAYCSNEGAGILTPDSTLYPKRLKRIQGKPIVLYYKGVLQDLDLEVCIAEVGTRNMTEYGCQTAYAMAYDLTRAGAVVVSGLAKGVDGMAHRGAIDAGGVTVAVTGCGIDRVYPSEHKPLMQEIIKKGMVMTEFPPFTPPMGRNFPIRNRIVSGLSLGTLVIEAPSKSGALITASVAAKQGRDVFAIPGKLGEMSSTGTNELIRNGAKMVTGVPDILREYQTLYPDKIDMTRLDSKRPRITLGYSEAATPVPYTDKPEKKESKRPSVRKKSSDGDTDGAEKTDVARAEPYTVPEDVTEIRRIILTKLMSDEALTSDELVSGTELRIDELLVELTMLELEGTVEALPGGSYRLLK